MFTEDRSRDKYPPLVLPLHTTLTLFSLVFHFKLIFFLNCLRKACHEPPLAVACLNSDPRAYIYTHTPPIPQCFPGFALIAYVPKFINSSARSPKGLSWETSKCYWTIIIRSLCRRHMLPGRIFIACATPPPKFCGSAEFQLKL